MWILLPAQQMRTKKHYIRRREAYHIDQPFVRAENYLKIRLIEEEVCMYFARFYFSNNNHPRIKIKTRYNRRGARVATNQQICTFVWGLVRSGYCTERQRGAGCLAHVWVQQTAVSRSAGVGVCAELRAKITSKFNSNSDQSSFFRKK